MKHCTIANAAMKVDSRRHRLDRELTAGARQQTGVDGGETHVRVLGGIQVLRGTARHAARHERGAVIANCNQNKKRNQWHVQTPIWNCGSLITMNYESKCKIHTLWTRNVHTSTERRSQTAKERRIRLLTSGLKNFAFCPRRSDIGRHCLRRWLERGKHEGEAGRDERRRGRTDSLHAILQRATIKEGTRRIHERNVDGG
jgi:hypothetical protein